MKIFPHSKPELTWDFKGNHATLTTSVLAYAQAVKAVLNAHNNSIDYETLNPVFFTIKAHCQGTKIKLEIDGDMKALEAYTKNSLTLLENMPTANGGRVTESDLQQKLSVVETTPLLRVGK